MSANFYNADGGMLGSDIHDYYTGEPPGPPIKIWTVHPVGANFSQRCDDEAKRLKNVTSAGHPMHQKELKLVRVPLHIPVPIAPPYPVVEEVSSFTIFCLSGSVALLAVGSVTGKTVPLACCVYDSFGTNLNCGDPIDLPTNFTHNTNSVVTQPTAMDFAEAIFTFAMGGLVSLLVGAISEGVYKKLKDRIPKRWKEEILEVILDTITQPIRKILEDMAKDKLNEKVKDIKDKIKGQSKARAVLGSLGVTHV